MIAHLISCTVFALVAMAAVLLLRRQRAALRYTILLIAVLRFAVPTVWLAEVGERIAARTSAPALLNLALLPIRGPVSLSAPSTNIPVRAESRLPSAALILWASGSILIAGLWLRRAVRRVDSVRPATPEESDAMKQACESVGIRAELRIVPWGMTPGARGIFRAQVLISDGLSAELDPAELEAVIAHEAAHILRRDNLWAALTRAVTAVFWFHPLLWWMERSMLAERETACDDLVLLRGASREDYVRGIAKVCRAAFFQSKGAESAGYAGITGSNLTQRMEYIMSADVRPRSSYWQRALPAALAAAALMLPVTTGFLSAAPQSFEDPHYTAIVRQVEIYMGQNRAEDAVALLQDEIRRQPGRLEYRQGLASVLIRSGQFDEAIVELQGALATVDAKSPTAAHILFQIGEAHRRKGELDAAIDWFTRSRDALPTNLEPSIQIALILDGTGRRSAAAEEYRAILKADPSHAIALNNLAYLLSDQEGKLDEALEYAVRASRKLPQNEDVLDTVGWIYFKKKMPDAAIHAFGTVLLEHQGNGSKAFREHLAAAIESRAQLSPAMRQLRVLLPQDWTAERELQIKALLHEMGL